MRFSLLKVWDQGAREVMTFWITIRAIRVAPVAEVALLRPASCRPPAI
jgi:hypothetical protein